MISSKNWNGWGSRLVAGVGPAACLALLAGACAPTIRVQAPEEPIEINLNVRIEQEVRVRVERDLEELFEENPELF
jgi:hypothetical protein